MLIQMKRLLKHRLARGTRHFLPQEAMQRLTQDVANAEKSHSGEIRICVESRLPPSYLLRPLPMRAITRQRALSKFSKLRVWDTEHNNGVLIYLLLPERAIEVVADRGINARVAPDTWRDMVGKLQSRLRNREFEDGLREAVARVSDELALYFPLSHRDTDVNELSDTPDVGD